MRAPFRFSVISSISLRRAANRNESGGNQLKEAGISLYLGRDQIVDGVHEIFRIVTCFVQILNSKIVGVRFFFPLELQSRSWNCQAGIGGTMRIPRKR
jgi:hypothetical protein